MLSSSLVAAVSGQKNRVRQINIIREEQKLFISAVMRHRIVDTIDKHSFTSKITTEIVKRIQGLSHMFSISLLV